MDFYMQANAAETPPKLSTLTEKGHFTSGSPELAIPASTPGAAWFESVTAEIVNTIKELGVTPDKNSLNQLATAILTLKFPSGTAFKYLRDKNYSKNDIVFTNNHLYLCMSNNGPASSVVKPGTNDSVWQKIPLKQDVLALVPDATTSVKGIVQLCDNIKQNASNTSMAVTPHAVAQQVNTTCIKSLSVKGRTITYTRGDGTTGTITTQDTNTTYSKLSQFTNDSGYIVDSHNFASGVTVNGYKITVG